MALINPNNPPPQSQPSLLGMMTKLLESNEKTVARLDSLTSEMAELKAQTGATEIEDGDDLDGDDLEHADPAPATKPADVLDRPVELGCKVRDRLSGFVGLATVKAIHLNGCVRFYVQKQGLDDKGRPRSCEVFDVNTLEVLEAPGEWVTPGTPAGGIGGPFDDEVIAQIGVDATSGGHNLGTRAIRALRDLGISLEDE